VVGSQGGNSSVRGTVSAVTSQERQGAMHNQSLKRSTRCAGPPARLEGDGKQREGGGNGAVPET
jgi:hypothetical protein